MCFFGEFSVSQCEMVGYKLCERFVESKRIRQSSGRACNPSIRFQTIIQLQVQRFGFAFRVLTKTIQVLFERLFAK